ncbi:DUF1707 SHOCT-like domain-containing protein [Capillimicrobium parvum]|uniref:DUF1707 domain-containing protein n=1 Tax=Capillimicrobium parvum TaxID=2884022 RepID=A0A9E6Y123_9ACTN|nr:DUF1707 domain-containing protein [Capillimicrobium parvum]UGS38237.1 hypothetical protein DSM104329_04661 [Capillimicrobium parvum]
MAATIWASDAERENCSRLLHGAYAEGRISLGDLEERLHAVQRAGSRAELTRLTRGIPQRRLERFGAAVDRFDRAALKAHGTTAVAVNASLVGIWEITGGGAFWPAIALVPSALLLGWHAASSWTVRRFVRRRYG